MNTVDKARAWDAISEKNAEIAAYREALDLISYLAPRRKLKRIHYIACEALRCPDQKKWKLAQAGNGIEDRPWQSGF